MTHTVCNQNAIVWENDNDTCIKIIYNPKQFDSKE